MPRNYVLKNSPIDKNRIQKVCKKVLDESAEDRNLALDAHAFFRNMVDENPNDSASKNLMVDCLKLAQTSKTSTLKVVELLVKLEAARSRGSEGKEGAASLYDQLNEIA